MAKKTKPKYAALQSKPTAQTVTNPDRWDRSHGTYLSGRAAIDGADNVAVEMERYWGVGRLRLLVSNELREKFDRQRYLYNAALQNGDLEQVKVQSQRMINAYMALNGEALAQGCKRLDLQTMEVALDEGVVLIIVPDSYAIDTAKLASDERSRVVYTLGEIAKIVSLIDPVLKAKRLWPGATVERVERKGDPLNGIDRPDGFDTPFDDGVPNVGGR